MRRQDREVSERAKIDDQVVALAGNPNVGKSTVFNRLTGLRQHTGNWPGKTVERARVAFGVAGPVPLRAATAERLAEGKPVSEETAEAFAQAVKEDINPRDSWRAAKDFRMHIAVESARRAFIEAVKLAGGDL